MFQATLFFFTIYTVAAASPQRFSRPAREELTVNAAEAANQGAMGSYLFEEAVAEWLACEHDVLEDKVRVLPATRSQQEDTARGQYTNA